MITSLHGKLVEVLPTQVTVDVNGVGYELLIPLSSYDKLPQPGAEVRLLTHLAVREDAHVLYGFMSAQERELFRERVQKVAALMEHRKASQQEIERFRRQMALPEPRVRKCLKGKGLHR